MQSVAANKRLVHGMNPDSDTHLAFNLEQRMLVGEVKF